MSNRREFLSMLGAGAGVAAVTLWPSLARASATGTDSCLLVLLLRGGLDGLHAVPPYGDPDYARLRGSLALAPAGPAMQDAPALRLDGTFALHPALNFAAQLYAHGEFMPIVAAAPPYWGRSHFEAQDCLENGTDSPDGARTGWLNRAVEALHDGAGLAVATVPPLIMRGSARIESWSPPLPERINPILLQRLEPLYGEDPTLSGAFSEAVLQHSAIADMAPSAPDANAPTPERRIMGRQDAGTRTLVKGEGRLSTLMRAAGGFMARPGGPRVGLVEDYGWDTHANQAPILARKLRELDDAFAEFHRAAASIWNRTAIVVVTEFGRTARINGTNGTDHGTGGAMFLLGGAVRGGRVGGQWPGMAPARLYQDRDIHATTDQRAVFKGLLAQHMGLPEAVLAERVFPASGGLAPLEGLIAARV